MSASRLVVEWTRSGLRVALAEGVGPRARLRTLRSQTLGIGGEAAAGLRTLLRGVKSAGAEVVGVISREQVITRVVKFPSLDRAELAPMAEHYAKAQLPYPRDELVMDFHILSQQEGFSTIAIVACQREVVDRHISLFREAGLRVGILTVSSWGVLGWYRQAVRGQDVEEPCLVVNVDDMRADLVLTEQGRIMSSRSVGQGAQEWVMAGQSGELLSAEVERSRTAIRKELPGAELRSVVLTGVGDLPLWKDQIAQRIGLPVRIVDAVEPFGKAAGAQGSPLSPVVAGGLACGELRGLLNLSPPELRQHAAHRQQVKELEVVGLLLVGALTLGGSLLSLEISRQRQVAVQLDHLLAELTPTAKQVQAQSRSAELLGATLEDRQQLAYALAGVLRDTPDAVSLERLAFERSRHELVIRGSASSTQDVLDYLKTLERLQTVAAAELKYTTRRSTPAGERTDFELVIRQGKGS